MGSLEEYEQQSSKEYLKEVIFHDTRLGDILEGTTLNGISEETTPGDISGEIHQLLQKKSLKEYLKLIQDKSLQ